MALLEDRQDSFGGPRIARFPDWATDAMVANLDGGGFRIFGLSGLSVTTDSDLVGGQFPQAITTSQVISDEANDAPPANWAYNDVQINDKAESSASFASAFNVGHHLSDGWGGNRNSLQIELIVDDEGSGTGGNLAAGYFAVEARVPFDLAAAPGNERGGCFAINPSAVLNDGATNWGFVGCAEFNLACETGSSVKHKGILPLVYNATDSVQGSLYDYMLGLSSQVNGVDAGGRAKVGILVGPQNSNHPISTTGKIMATTGSATVAEGIDFSSYTITNYLIKGSTGGMTPTGSVVCSGNTVVGGRVTGFTASTGTASKGAIDYDAATLAQLRARVKALDDALTSHGLIGA